MPVIMVKNGTTGNEYVGSSAETTFRCSSVYSAVHLDLECGTAFFSQRRQLFNFIDCIVNRRLPTKSGIHAHTKNKINVMKHFYYHHQRSSRINRNRCSDL